jgi:cytoskeleton protein RodZ
VALAFGAVADIGSTLREARMRMHIDMSEVESRTKIRAKYLRAIENEEWDLLPGPVYVKSFLRTYGDFLGLDSRMLIDEYKRRYERPSDHELRPVSTWTRERERAARGPLVPSWAIIGVVLVGVVVALYVVGSGTGSKSPSSAGLHSQTTGHRTVTHHHKSSSTALASKPSDVKLQLVPTGTVYVCLVNGDGKMLIPGVIFSAGQTIPTKTARKMLLTLGNASVQMKVNGASVPVTPSASSIGFMLDPAGNHPLPASQQPRCA